MSIQTDRTDHALSNGQNFQSYVYQNKKIILCDPKNIIWVQLFTHVFKYTQCQTRELRSLLEDLVTYLRKPTKSDMFGTVKTHEMSWTKWHFLSLFFTLILCLKMTVSDRRRGQEYYMAL